jgi:hypothetical protein
MLEPGICYAGSRRHWFGLRRGWALRFRPTTVAQTVGLPFGKIVSDDNLRSKYRPADASKFIPVGCEN